MNLSNSFAYFFATIDFGTAENEPAQNLQTFANNLLTSRFQPSPCRGLHEGCVLHRRLRGRPATQLRAPECPPQSSPPGGCKQFGGFTSVKRHGEFMIRRPALPGVQTAAEGWNFMSTRSAGRGPSCRCQRGFGLLADWILQGRDSGPH